jgi:positive regulator of sigma E activity
VQIELAPRNVLHAAWVVYGGPLAGALAGAGIAFVADLTDLGSLLVIAAGLLAGGYLSRRRLRRSDCLRRFTPVITQRLAGTE